MNKAEAWESWNDVKAATEKLSLFGRWEKLNTKTVRDEPSLYRVFRYNAGMVLECMLNALVEHVKAWRGDIIYDLYRLLDEARAADEADWDLFVESPIIIFGFRQNGVDHASFILDRLESPEVYGEISGSYKAIMVCTVQHTDWDTWIVRTYTWRNNTEE